MLTYQLPAIRSEACMSVSVAEPCKGLVAGVIGTATPAFFPGSAGPWKWAAVAGPVRPGIAAIPSQLLGRGIVCGRDRSTSRGLVRGHLGGPLEVSLELHGFGTTCRAECQQHGDRSSANGVTQECLTHVILLCGQFAATSGSYLFQQLLNRREW